LSGLKSSATQAFATNINGFNRPTIIRFGPDGCAYAVDYGAVRDLSEDSHFIGAANGSLVQIPGRARGSARVGESTLT
jgi:hypothetical protein